jgi:hypothetical protein
MTLLVKCYHVVDLSCITRVDHRLTDETECQIRFLDDHGDLHSGYVAASAWVVQELIDMEQDARMACEGLSA